MIFDMITSVITILIFSHISLFYCFMFYYGIKYDKTNYIFKNNKEVYKNLAILVFFLLFVIFIFFVRLSRKGFQLDLNKIFTSIKETVLLYSLLDATIMFIILLLVVSLFLMGSKYCYTIIKRIKIKMFIYLYQFAAFRNVVSNITMFWSNLRVFGIIKVLEYTETYNKTVRMILVMTVQAIWPNAIIILERNVYFGLIPYVIYFDYVINLGVLINVFYILPWVFIYSFLRKQLDFLFQHHNTNTLYMTIERYGLKENNKNQTKFILVFFNFVKFFYFFFIANWRPFINKISNILQLVIYFVLVFLFNNSFYIIITYLSNII